MPTHPTLIAGVMSGTSADGIDVAITRITPSGRITLLAHQNFPYPTAVRKKLLEVAENTPLPASEFSLLNWRLGELYADAVQTTATTHNLKPHLVGLHGQTIYHQAATTNFLGKPTRATWQTGEPAVLAERLRIPVVSDLRPADLAAGGQAAPLVPMLDYTLFRHATRNRILLNLGGIANLTAIPAAASIDQLLAFDTGPANMVIDALMQRLFSKKYDASGRTAARGKVLPPVLTELLRNPYFAAAPPKSCGREQFGSPYVDRLLTLAGNAEKSDIIATATALTASTITDAYARFCWPHLGQLAPLARATDLIVSGGGARNTHLIGLLRTALEPLRVRVQDIADAPGHIPAEAKEAVAFALLAWLTWNRRPGNVTSATGATHPTILGKISYS